MQNSLFSFLSLPRFKYRHLLYVFVTVILLICIVFAGLFVYIKYNPQILSKKVAYELRQNVDVDLSFSDIDVELFPLPAISFKDLKLKHEEFVLEVSYVTVTPSFADIVAGKLTLGHVSLLRPVLHWQNKSLKFYIKHSQGNMLLSRASNGLSFEQSDLLVSNLQSLQNLLNNLQSKIPDFFFGSIMDLKHGKLVFESNTTLIQCENVHSSLILGSLDFFRGDVSFANAYILQDKKNFAQLQDFQMKLSADVKKSIELNVHLKLSIPDLISNLDLSTKLSYIIPKNSQVKQQSFSLQGAWNIHSQWIIDQIPITAKSFGNIEGDLFKSLHFKDVNIRLEDSVTKLNAVANLFDPINHNFKPKIKGQLIAEQFSLSQWFTFARNLPDGLENALDSIKGKLHFVADLNKLDVHYIDVHAAGANFIGKGGVSNWTEPIIFLDVMANSLKLEDIYPELEGKQASNLYFPNAPFSFVKQVNENNREENNFLKYDIRIGTKKLLAWNLPLEEVNFRCSPANLENNKIAEKYKDAVMLDFKANKFFEGRSEVKGMMYPLPSEELGYDFKVRLRNVLIAKPLEQLSGRKIISGRLDLDTDFSSKGDSISQFLISKKGNFTLNIKSGRFHSRIGKVIPFENFSLHGKFTNKNSPTLSERKLPLSLNYSGQWKANVKTKDFEVKSSWNGKLQLTGEKYSTVVLDNIPSVLNVILKPSVTGLTVPLTFDVKGRFFLNSKKYHAKFEKATVTSANFGSTTLSGKAGLNFNKSLTWSADFTAKTSELPSLIQRLGIKEISDSHLHLPYEATLHTKANYAKNILRFNSIQLKAGKMQLNGNLHRTFSPSSPWHFNFMLNELDLDSLYFIHTSDNKTAKMRSFNTLGRSEHDNKDINQTLPSGWNWLNSLNINGKININLMRVKTILFSNLFIPIQINNSKIICKGITAKVYEAKVSIDFMSWLEKNILQMKTKVNIKNINLHTLTRDLGIKTIISSLASLSFDLQGAIHKNILSSLFGTWNLYVGKGFMQSYEKNGKLSKDKLYITSLSDNGTLDKGILRSQRFFLMGPELEVQGSGQLNLINESIDMRLVADIDKMIDIPIRYYGDLYNPQRDAHAGAVILASIGALGSGIFNLIGGLFSIFINDI